MSYTRQCPNWIDTFREWTFDRTQVRVELLDWGAIFCLAAALKRKVAITRTSGHLGSWDCYPFLYIIAVGPAGIGKTTSVRLAFDLLYQIPSITPPPTFTTVEGLVDDFVNANDNAIYLAIEELEDIMQKNYSNKMFGFFTSMYDGKIHIKQKTLTRGQEFADKPCLNMFAGTTPQWVADNIPINILNGGFGSRVCWMYVPGLRRRRMYYREEMKMRDYLGIERKLLADLDHISKLEGEYTITDEALDFMEKYNEEIPSKIKYKKIEGYIMRKSVFVHKLAMLMHVAISDTFVLDIHDFKNAIDFIERLEPGLPKIFETTGNNPYNVDMKEMAMFVAENPGIEEPELLKEFKNAAEPWKLPALIDGLLAATVIRSERVNGHRAFYFVEDE